MGDDVVTEQILAPDDVEVAADPSATHVRDLWFRVFLMGGLVAGAALVVGVVGRNNGLLILDPLTRQFNVLLIASLALLLVASTLVRLAPGWREVVRVLVILGFCFLLSAAVLLGALSVVEGESRYPSPDGRSILMVSEGIDMIDTQWEVTVQQSSPLLARTWVVGCFNDDDMDNGLASIEWVSSTLIEAKDGSGRTHQVAVDPRNTQPASTLSVGCHD
jgi:hypothetical protein